MSSPLDVSSRAVLYGRTPVGLGTPLVESLTGFLSRVSFARALLITNVLHFLVRPLVPDGFLRPRTDLSRFLAQTAVCYDGLGLPARTVVPALERLTGVPDLALHTCLPWAGLLSRQSPGAVRYARKRWCARCLSDWHRDGVEPWDPLLWRLAPVVRCPIHRTPLSERCPACGHTVNLVTQRVPPGHCEHCGAMLHEDDPVLASDDSDLDADPRARLQWWIALAAGRMLCAQREACSRASPAGVVHLVEDARVRYARGGVATLARHLGMSSTRLKHWSAGTRGIRLSPFLEACVRLGVDPVHVAFGPAVRDASPAWSPWGGAARPWPAMRPIPRSASYRQSRAARWREVGRQIDRLLASGTPPPLRETARDLGVGLDALQRCLPGHYQRLVSSRAERFSSRREQAREALDPRRLGGGAALSQCGVGRRVRLSHPVEEVVSRAVCDAGSPARRADCRCSGACPDRALPCCVGGRPCVARCR